MIALSLAFTVTAFKEIPTRDITVTALNEGIHHDNTVATTTKTYGDCRYDSMSRTSIALFISAMLMFTVTSSVALFRLLTISERIAQKGIGGTRPVLGKGRMHLMTMLVLLAGFLFFGLAIASFLGTLLVDKDGYYPRERVQVLVFFFVPHFMMWLIWLGIIIRNRSLYVEAEE